MQKKKLDQVVYEYIVAQIEEDELFQREHITEQYIADQLEISRTPVRRAFDRLVEDNYLENIKNVGVRVKIRSLTKKDFQERLDLFERLFNHYLFDLEKKEKVFDTTQLHQYMEEMATKLKTEESLFERVEFFFWKELLKYSANNYSKKVLIQTMKYTLLDEGEVFQVLKDSRELKMNHFRQLTKYLEEMNYPLVRREVRILLNKLKLNVLESGLTYK